MSPKSEWKFFKDPKGEYRWRKKRPSGQLISASRGGFATEEEALKDARRMGYKEESE